MSITKEQYERIAILSAPEEEYISTDHLNILNIILCIVENGGVSPKVWQLTLLPMCE